MRVAVSVSSLNAKSVPAYERGGGAKFLRSAAIFVQSEWARAGEVLCTVQ